LFFVALDSLPAELLVPGTAKATSPTFACRELINQVELDLHDWNDNQLRQSIERIQRKGIVTAIPR
jgi:hypothetical protein